MVLKKSNHGLYNLWKLKVASSTKMPHASPQRNLRCARLTQARCNQSASCMKSILILTAAKRSHQCSKPGGVARLSSFTLPSSTPCRPPPPAEAVDLVSILECAVPFPTFYFPIWVMLG